MNILFLKKIELWEKEIKRPRKAKLLKVLLAFPDLDDHRGKLKPQKRKANQRRSKLKRVILLTISALLVNVAVGQKTFIGIKGGGHTGSSFIEHTIFNINLNSTFQSGVHGGLFLKYFPKSRDIFFKSGIQFSVNYIQKGWGQSFLTNEPTYTSEMNYLEIPIEAIGYFGNKNNYFITAGLYLEYLLSFNQDDIPDLENLGGQDFYTYEPDRDNEIGYGARLSAGMFREFSFGMLHLEGFFTYSFSNFIDPGDLTDQTPDISNLWTTGVSLGYLIPLKKKK